MSPQPDATTRGARHHDCPDSCAWEATVAGGRVIRLRAAAEYPTTQGQLCPKPLLEIHSEYAAALGIADGDPVRVHNDRGSLTLPATISDAVQPGVVAMPFGWWHRSSPQRRGVNAQTNADFPEDGSGSAFFHENLVEVVAAG